MTIGDTLNKKNMANAGILTSLVSILVGACAPRGLPIYDVGLPEVEKGAEVFVEEGYGSFNPNYSPGEIIDYEDNTTNGRHEFIEGESSFNGNTGKWCNVRHDPFGLGHKVETQYDGTFYRVKCPGDEPTWAEADRIEAIKDGNGNIVYEFQR